MSGYAHKLDGVWTEIAGAFTNDEGSFPPGWAEGVSGKERALAGVAEIAETNTDPKSHQRLIGVELADVGGVPMRAGIYEDLTLAERQAVFQNQVRQARWQHEQGGFTTPAGRARSDDATQSKITGALVMFDTDPDLKTLDWELAPGVWASATQADVAAMGVLVGQHVQACFTRSRQLCEAAQAATKHADLTALDLTAGWPS